MRKINQVKLFVNDDKKSKDVAKKIEKELIKNNFIISDKGFELAISIGGDGAFLRMVRECNYNTHPYFIGINSGTLGFLAEVEINNLDNFIDRLKNNDYYLNEMNIQKTVVRFNNKKEILRTLNEVIIRY